MSVSKPAPTIFEAETQRQADEVNLGRRQHGFKGATTWDPHRPRKEHTGETGQTARPARRIERSPIGIGKLESAQFLAAQSAARSEVGSAPWGPEFLQNLCRVTH